MTLDIVCVLKIEPDNYKRPVYSKMWVDRLYKSLKRHMSIPFQFTCLSNDLNNKDCEYSVISLVDDSHWGWWNKLEVFRKDLFHGPALLLDLDLVVCKDLAPILKNLPQDKILLPKEPLDWTDALNTSFVYWNGDYSKIYSEFVKNQDKIKEKFQWSTTECPAIGDGAYIPTVVGDVIEDFNDYVPEGFFGWKHHLQKTELNDPGVIIFTSTEKPYNNLDIDLVAKNWID